MKSDRLLAILLLLRTHGRIPARELAARLEVSPRTVYRDVEALSASGVPVYAERGRHGGIALLPGFRTDVTGLTADEARALFVLAAQGAHTALGLDDALGSALRKVMAALPAPHRPGAELTGRRILVDPERWLGGPRPAPAVDTLHTAVLTDRRLRIRYRHSGAPRPRTYTVDPYGLVAKANVWYLVADRHGRPQLFRADRVIAATVTDVPVRRRAGVELADAWAVLRSEVEDRPAPVRVTARIRTDRLDLAVRILGPSLAGPPRTGEAEAARPAPEPGWALLDLAFPVLRAVRQLLQFGGSLEVLAPPEARTEMTAAATDIVALYAKDPTLPAPPPDGSISSAGRPAGGRDGTD